jgi:hypothetical protein
VDYSTHPTGPDALTPMGIFVGIFIKPRQTVRAILSSGPSVAAAVGLALLGGAVSGFDGGLDTHLEDATPLATALVAGTMGGAIGGLIGFFIFGWMYCLVGRLLGGSGTQWDIYHGLGWTQIPSITGIVPLIGLAVLAANGQADTPAYLAVTLAYLVVLVWALVSMIRGLAEAHQFSSWASLGTTILCAIIAVAVILGVVFGIMALL